MCKKLVADVSVATVMGHRRHNTDDSLFSTIVLIGKNMLALDAMLLLVAQTAQCHDTVQFNIDTDDDHGWGRRGNNGFGGKMREERGGEGGGQTAPGDTNNIGRILQILYCVNNTFLVCCFQGTCISCIHFACISAEHYPHYERLPTT